MADNSESLSTIQYANSCDTSTTAASAKKIISLVDGRINLSTLHSHRRLAAIVKVAKSAPQPSPQPVPAAKGRPRRSVLRPPRTIDPLPKYGTIQQLLSKTCTKKVSSETFFQANLRHKNCPILERSRRAHRRSYLNANVCACVSRRRRRRRKCVRSDVRASFQNKARRFSIQFQSEIVLLLQRSLG